MSKTITATWNTAKGHGFADGQTVLLLGFDGNGQWDEAGQLVTIHRTSNRVALKSGRKQVWAGGVASKFWATPAPEKSSMGQTPAAKKALAKAEAPAPVEAPDGVELRTSGKHGLKEGSVVLFHGSDKSAPAKRGRKVTLRIVDRVWITGVDSKGTEQMRVHIAKAFWAAPIK